MEQEQGEPRRIFNPGFNFGFGLRMYGVRLINLVDAIHARSRARAADLGGISGAGDAARRRPVTVELV